MFTFSFSSAFAYTTTTAKYDGTLAGTYFDQAIKEVKTTDTNGPKGYVTVGGYDVSADVLVDQQADILAYLKAEHFDTTGGEYAVTKHDLYQLLNVTASTANEEMLADLQKSLVAAQYALDEADVLAALGSLNIGD